MKNERNRFTNYKIKGTILIFLVNLVIFVFMVLLSGCFIFKDTEDKAVSQVLEEAEAIEETSIVSGDDSVMEVPREERWGIYLLNYKTQEVSLVYGSQEKIDYLHLSSDGTRFAFSKFIGGNELENTEVCILNIDGSNFSRLTDNNLWDVYPRWSPDGINILFLTTRNQDLDIYIMNTQGQDARKLYDSGSHDADIDWKGDKITFTSGSCIWIMDEDGADLRKITDPPRAGEWGNAVLPFGDYDPRLSYDGKLVVFERMVGDSSTHGNYDIFTISSDGTVEKRLTETGYTQGLANWSRDGEQILYMVSAMGSEGKFDIFLMNSDGTDNQNITPDYFPADFLCYNPIFSLDEEEIFFIGEWWME